MFNTVSFMAVAGWCFLPKIGGPIMMPGGMVFNVPLGPLIMAMPGWVLFGGTLPV